VCADLGRRYVLVERNPEAVDIAQARLTDQVARPPGRRQARC